MGPEAILFNYFPTDKKSKFIAKAVRNPLALFRLIKLVANLPSLRVPKHIARETAIGRYLGKRNMFFKQRTFAHAVLRVQDYHAWLLDEKRRNLRKALRHCAKQGLTAEVVSPREGIDAYAKIQARRGAEVNFSTFSWINHVEGERVIMVVVRGEDSEPVSMTAGLQEANLALILVSVASKQPQYSRWMSLDSFIFEAIARNSNCILSGIKIGVTLGNLEFQDRFGFETFNIKLRN